MVEQQSQRSWLSVIVTSFIVGLIVVLLIFLAKNFKPAGFMDGMNRTSSGVDQMILDIEKSADELEKLTIKLEEDNKALAWSIYSTHELESINSYVKQSDDKWLVINHAVKIYNSLIVGSIDAQTFYQEYQPYSEMMRAVTETLGSADIPEGFKITTMPVNYYSDRYIYSFEKLYEASVKFVELNTPEGVPEGVQLIY